VGTNLVRLSELAGVDLETYNSTVLPRILEQIINCKDTIAQEYLMDCVIQVFPDDFHLATLETFLSTCSQLQENVNVKNIIITLMNRLSNFAKNSADNIGEKVEMFPLFHKYSSQIIESPAKKMPLSDILQLQVALVNFATKCYPERIEYIDNVLTFAVAILRKQEPSAGKKEGKVESKCVKLVTQLLELPLESLKLRILDLESYGPLLEFLDWDQHKAVSVTIAESIVKARAKLDTLTKVNKLFGYIVPLIRDEGEAKVVSDADRFEFDQEQNLVARLFHNIVSDDTDTHFKLYAAARKHFGRGGTQRIEATLPPLVFGSLQLIPRIRLRDASGGGKESLKDKDEKEEKDGEVQVKPKKVFGFVHETISVLSPHYPDLALRLFLQAAMSADTVGYEAIAYEFIAQAFLVYEEEVSESKAQFNAITYIIACLQTFKSFGQENYDTLITKATQHAMKLLKKTDQCRAVYSCSHLFWPGDDSAPGHRDEKRVLSCLQRSLKIANACMGHQVHLFVEILNKYLYFFDRGCPSITVQYLKGLIALIDEHIPNLDASDTSRIAKIHYMNTLQHIKEKQGAGDELAVRYKAIDDDGEAGGDQSGATAGGGE
jgi:vacuolar protein sorting-associated protein 35